MRVIVTGANSGIGRAIAEAAVKTGYCVHLVARDQVRLSAAVRQLRDFGNVSYTRLDLADLVALTEFCQSWTQDLYGLVNNAGYWREDPVDELDAHLFQDMLSVNLVAPYVLSKGLLAKLRTGGRVVNIASQLGTAGRARMGAYSATKHGLVGLTKCWASELWERKITVNAVCPGWVNTESNRRELAELAARDGTSLETEMARISEGTTLRRFVEPDEVANLVCFLLGSSSSGITGQIYDIK
jgi:NAD(P)-dependent dehydrogenase (short-subunit alcohol dehydrogenase family)